MVITKINKKSSKTEKNKIQISSKNNLNYKKYRKTKICHGTITRNLPISEVEVLKKCQQSVCSLRQLKWKAERSLWASFEDEGTATFNHTGKQNQKSWDILCHTMEIKFQHTENRWLLKFEVMVPLTFKCCFENCMHWVTMWAPRHLPLLPYTLLSGMTSKRGIWWSRCRYDMQTLPIAPVWPCNWSLPSVLPVLLTSQWPNTQVLQKMFFLTENYIDIRQSVSINSANVDLGAWLLMGYYIFRYENIKCKQKTLKSMKAKI